MADTKLKPCPFCGGETAGTDVLGGKYRFVPCGSCRAFGPVALTEEKAITGWNRRRTTGEDALREALEKIEAKVMYDASDGRRCGLCDALNPLPFHKDACPIGTLRAALAPTTDTEEEG